MYGCSESGAIATRQINKGDKWELLEEEWITVMHHYS
jgi:hypothetical protein